MRKAQGNFHFASIYEQRKTNKILIGGFTTLEQAINQVGSAQISSSIDGLSSSIDHMASSMEESAERIHSRVGDIVDGNAQHHQEMLEKSSELIAIERENGAKQAQALRDFDNFRRGIKPFPYVVAVHGVMHEC